MSEEERTCCAHRVVNHDPIHLDNGLSRDRWTCAICPETFTPSAALAERDERIAELEAIVTADDYKARDALVWAGVFLATERGEKAQNSVRELVVQYRRMEAAYKLLRGEGNARTAENAAQREEIERVKRNARDDLMVVANQRDTLRDENAELRERIEAKDCDGRESLAQELRDVLRKHGAAWVPQEPSDLILAFDKALSAKEGEPDD